jgi:hypothetical protein
MSVAASRAPVVSSTALSARPPVACPRSRSWTRQTPLDAAAARAIEMEARDRTRSRVPTPGKLQVKRFLSDLGPLQRKVADRREGIPQPNPLS